MTAKKIGWAGIDEAIIGRQLFRPEKVSPNDFRLSAGSEQVSESYIWVVARLRSLLLVLNELGGAGLVKAKVVRRIFVTELSAVDGMLCYRNHGFYRIRIALLFTSGRRALLHSLREQVEDLAFVSIHHNISGCFSFKMEICRNCLFELLNGPGVLFEH